MSSSTDNNALDMKDDHDHDQKINNNNDDDDASNKSSTTPTPKKSHCTTICMVPPCDNNAWEALTTARTQLRDPGFYRWPPHANLLYPFLQFSDNQDMVEALQRVATRSKPFLVSLSTLGTFGGKHRGVLWVYPFSTYTPPTDDDGSTEEEGAFCNPSEPLIQLQSILQEEFPMLQENGQQHRFHPHMTLSHFESIDDAMLAQTQIESWWTKKTFWVKEVYVLERNGDEGQFQRIATIPLLGTQDEKDDGNSDATATTSSMIQIHDPPLKFPAMPDTEEAWVYEERMKLKERRNKGGGRRRGRGRGGGRTRSWSKERKVDTPEEKRAVRKAKREALEMKQREEQQQQQQQQNE